MGITDQIIQAESGGNANAQNGASSAGGLGQFTDSTWLNVIRKHRPDLAEKFSPSDLLAMKTDPILGRQMTEHFVGDNTEYLRGKGFEPTPGNVYLAHFAGPAGAASLLGASPDTPVASIMSPDAIKANPFLKNMTVADMQGWASRKMGGASAPGSGYQQFAPASAGVPSLGGGAPAAATAPAPETAAPANPAAALPAMIQQFQQSAAPVMQPVHINTPAPVGLARAKLLARAMAQTPVPGGQA